MTPEFKFQPSKTYATEENARKTIRAILVSGDRFMIVGVPGTKRYAPVVISSPSGLMAAYASCGFTVVG